MTELLHSRDALAEVATSFAEPARSWARGVLATWYGALPAGLPLGDLLWDPVLARRPDGLAEAALAALADSQPPTEGLAATLAFAGSWGVDLGASAETVAAARTHLGHAGNADLHLVRLIADREPLTPDLLQIASAIPDADAPGAQASLAALVLRYAAGAGAGPEVARDVLAPLPTDMLYRVFDALGLGLLPPPATADPDAAVAHGAALAGAPPPELRARGGRKGRARAWLRALAQDSGEPLWLAASAVIDLDAPPDLIALLLAQASHGRAFRGVQPVADVVTAHAGYRVPTLIAAREAGLGPAAPLALRAFEQGNAHVAPLLVDAAPATFAPLALQAAAGWPTLLTIGAAIAALHALPTDPGTLLAPMLARPSEREGALSVAAWCPSPATLEALLRLPVPQDPQIRSLLASALAWIGTPDAALRCRAILALPETPAPAHLIAHLDALHLP